MISHFRPAATLLAAFVLITGIAYPLAITGLAQVAMPQAANGSLVRKDQAIVGSQLIGQAFTSDRYLWPRPSAAGEKGYDAANSSGSNLGPLSQKLIDRVAGDAAALRKAGVQSIPGDAVTASGSGLDPHISPAFAAEQVPRIAAARGVSEDKVRALVEAATDRPVLGFFGAPRTHVLRVNLLLDERLPGGSG